MRIAVLQFDADKGLGLLEQPLREAGCELSIHLDEREPVGPAFDGLIVLGGIADPAGDEATRAARATVEGSLADGIPVLGICLGAEIVSLAAGGSTPECVPEYGFREVTLLPAAGEDPLLSGLPSAFHVFQAHGFSCAPPADAVSLARSLDGMPSGIPPRRPRVGAPVSPRAVGRDGRDLGRERARRRDARAPWRRPGRVRGRRPALHPGVGSVDGRDRAAIRRDQRGSPTTTVASCETGKLTDRAMKQSAGTSRCSASARSTISGAPTVTCGCSTAELN